MIASIFELLNSIGFHHPVHPAFTHIPMGMAMGGFAFTLAAYFLKKPFLYKTAHHCAVLGLIGIPPTIILGLMDWQYSYGGEWLTPIKIKLVMAGLITIFMIAIVKYGSDAEKSPVRMLVLYTLTLLSAINLGYWGGDLIFA